jgi:hypothetical protein
VATVTVMAGDITAVEVITMVGAAAIIIIIIAGEHCRHRW